jgi:hypothetical protein
VRGQAAWDEVHLIEELMIRGATARAIRAQGVQGMQAGWQTAGGLTCWLLSLIAGDASVIGAKDKSVPSACPTRYRALQGKPQ